MKFSELSLRYLEVYRNCKGTTPKNKLYGNRSCCQLKAELRKMNGLRESPSPIYIYITPEHGMVASNICNLRMFNFVTVIFFYVRKQVEIINSLVLGDLGGCQLLSKHFSHIQFLGIRFLMRYAFWWKLIPLYIVQPTKMHCSAVWLFWGNVQIKQLKEHLPFIRNVLFTMNGRGCSLFLATRRQARTLAG